MNQENKKKTLLVFALTLLGIVAIFLASVIKTKAYNSRKHTEEYAGAALFHAEETPEDKVSVKAAARSSTWTKLFDFANSESLAG